MSIIRVHKAQRERYVILDTTALNDPRLSYRAKGLHAYLMSKPDQWRVKISQLAQLSPREGREAITTALRELQEAGYLHRTRRHDVHGHIGWETTVYETSRLATLNADEDAGETNGLESPSADQPDMANPPQALLGNTGECHVESMGYGQTIGAGDVQKIAVQPNTVQANTVQANTVLPALVKTEYRIKTEIGKTEKEKKKKPTTLGDFSAPETPNPAMASPTSVTATSAALMHQDGNGTAPYSGPLWERFNLFWQAYPRKMGKGAARKAWKKLKPDEALLAQMLKAIQFQQGSYQWNRDDGQYIPYPATWLNQERWEDEPPPYYSAWDLGDEEDDA